MSMGYINWQQILQININSSKQLFCYRQSQTPMEREDGQMGDK
jgi:hypothetical protein